jgi:CheY-like chemotaxis protein
MSCTGPILVVDDDDGTREPLAFVIEREGYRVVRAGNGREALETLRKGLDPCVIFLDVMMPDLDGFAFRAEQLRDPRLAAIPTIVLTASELTVDAKAFKATVVVSKPVTADRILILVEEYCRRQPRGLIARSVHGVVRT